MKAIETRTRLELDELASKYSSSGFRIRIDKAYGNNLRVTMRHYGHVIISVDKAYRIGMLIRAMRDELNEGNFCPTCGAVR